LRAGGLAARLPAQRLGSPLANTAATHRLPGPVGNSGAGHPLADHTITDALGRRAREIDAAFSLIESELSALSQRQFEPDFPAHAQARLRSSLGLELPLEDLAVRWSAPLDVRRLYAQCVLGTFCRLIEREFDRSLAVRSDGDDAETLIRRFGFHAIDVTPCADGRLSGVIDYILRIPPAVVAYRKSYAGAMFDVEESLRHWEAVELGRWRESKPNAADENTRFLKIGVYHYSSVDPSHQGCAAHGSDTLRAGSALLERLQQFAGAVQQTHCCGARVATLLIGVDTDTDAIRVHVPDAAGVMSISRYIDNLGLYETTRSLAREAAKEAIRAAVAECAGVSVDDPQTEGMRWLCAYLLKNNLGQIDAVRAWHGGTYSDRGHTEQIIVVGDAVDDVQLRNLAFQAQMDTVEEGASDLDIGVSILRGLHEPRGLAVPILVHERYDARIPGAEARAAQRALRLQTAIAARYAALVESGCLLVRSVVRAADSSKLTVVATTARIAACAGQHTEAH
jgi:carboxysome shell carbonic anhydrase